jgi:signal transduction histidine kinase
MKLRFRYDAVTLLAALVLALLPALAWMQYRWLGQLSEAESERMQRTLRTSALQFARDFDGELARAQAGLGVEGSIARDENWSAYAERYSSWSERATHPGLVKDVLLIDAPGLLAEGARPEHLVRVAEDQLRLRRWNNEARAFEPWPWPEEFARARGIIAQQLGLLKMMRTRASGPGFRGGPGNISLTISGAKTLVAPVTLLEFPKDGNLPPRIDVLGFTLIELNLDDVKQTMLPGLARRHFQADGVPAYRLAVVDRENTSDVVWESEPGGARVVLASPDVTQDFAAPRPEQIFIVTREQATFTAGAPPPSPPPAPPPPPSPDPRFLPPPPGPGENVIVSVVEGRNGAPARTVRTTLGASEGRLRLLAQHREGSLEAAVARARSRNLLISSSVLVLLTLAIGLIVVSARRAQTLARQQMEFVAAVSHELRTPVSVIGTAAGNLADGVVADPGRVKVYGETIRGESRRLAETVERVLLLAGIASGRAAAARVRVDAAALVHEGIEACRAQIDAAGTVVEIDVAPDLPPVEVDRAALRSALQNLVSNAVKYGGDTRWLQVSAKLRNPSGYVVRERRLGAKAHQQPAVDFIVEDRGLGIAAEDRQHIFEPFYRGRDAVSLQIQGSGLGLNLVQRIAEAHHGYVSVASEPGKGSTFTLTLPAAIDRTLAVGQTVSVHAAGSPGMHGHGLSP